MKGFLNLECALEILHNNGFEPPRVDMNNTYGFLIKAKSESVQLLASYFRDGPFQSLEVEYFLPNYRPLKYNYMGKFNSPYAVDVWFNEKIAKARKLALAPENLPLYGIEKQIIRTKV